MLILVPSRDAEGVALLPLDPLAVHFAVSSPGDDVVDGGSCLAHRGRLSASVESFGRAAEDLGY